MLVVSLFSADRRISGAVRACSRSSWLAAWRGEPRSATGSMRALSGAGAGGIRLAVASIASLRMVFGSGPVLPQPPAGEGLKPDGRVDAPECVAGAAITLAMG